MIAEPCIAESFLTSCNGSAINDSAIIPHDAAYLSRTGYYGIISLSIRLHINMCRNNPPCGLALYRHEPFFELGYLIIIGFDVVQT
jgi:hypothetical protein